MKVILDIPDSSIFLGLSLVFSSNEGGEVFTVEAVIPSNGMTIKRCNGKDDNWEEEA